MVDYQISNLKMGVRFSSMAPLLNFRVIKLNDEVSLSEAQWVEHVLKSTRLQVRLLSPAPKHHTLNVLSFVNL